MGDISCAVCGEPYDAGELRDDDYHAYRELLRGRGCPSCGGEPPCRNCGHPGRYHRPRVERRSVYDPQTDQHLPVTPELLARAPWLRWAELANGNWRVHKTERGPCWGTGYDATGRTTGQDCGCADYQPEQTDDAHADHLASLLDDGEAAEDWERVTYGGQDT